MINFKKSIFRYKCENDDKIKLVCRNNEYYQNPNELCFENLDNTLYSISSLTLSSILINSFQVEYNLQFVINSFSSTFSEFSSVIFKIFILLLLLIFVLSLLLLLFSLPIISLLSSIIISTSIILSLFLYDA